MAWFSLKSVLYKCVIIQTAGHLNPACWRWNPSGNQRRLEETHRSCGRWFDRASDQGAAGWCRRKWPGTAESQTRWPRGTGRAATTLQGTSAGRWGQKKKKEEEKHHVLSTWPHPSDARRLLSHRKNPVEAIRSIRAPFKSFIFSICPII